MFAAAALAASLALSGVAAVPVQLAQLSAVEAALSPSNTTHVNQTAVSYEMNGNAGACGWYSKDADVVAGLPLEEYSDLASVSPYCGQYIVVTDPRVNKSITALVADASATNNTLSLSQGSWTALNGTASDLQLVDWRFANETETAEAKKALESGSSSSAAPSSTSSYVAPSSSAAPATTSAAAAKYEQKEQTTTSAKPSTTSYAPKTTTTSYAPKKTTTTTTQEAAATKKAESYSSSSSSSSSSSGSYSGQATYFYQNGVAGACGSVNSDSSYIVALQTSMYSGGSHCGKTITVNYGGKSIQAKVADECPSCRDSQSIDLSEGAFKALASLDVGAMEVSWSFSGSA